MNYLEEQNKILNIRIVKHKKLFIKNVAFCGDNNNLNTNVFLLSLRLKYNLKWNKLKDKNMYYKKEKQHYFLKKE